MARAEFVASLIESGMDARQAKEVATMMETMTREAVEPISVSIRDLASRVDVGFTKIGGDIATGFANAATQLQSVRAEFHGKRADGQSQHADRLWKYGIAIGGALLGYLASYLLPHH